MDCWNIQRRGGFSHVVQRATSEPAAVVLDLALPRLHGRDVLNKMAAHQLTASIPVVVATGTDAELNEGNVSSVLRKPVTGDALLTAVLRGINPRRRRQ
jgi:CheY-like chemotaxis protein